MEDAGDVRQVLLMEDRDVLMRVLVVVLLHKLVLMFRVFNHILG